MARRKLIDHKVLRTLFVMCMVCIFVAAMLQSVHANNFDTSQNGLRLEKQESPKIIITSTEGMQGDGFVGNYRYLTASQIASIVDEESADKYFASNQTDTYLSNVVYSAQTKVSQGDWSLQTISGLNLKAVSESLGLDTARINQITTRGSDGHSSLLLQPFTIDRYTLQGKNNNSNKVAVTPAIALKGTEDANELPRLVFGQTEAGDYNMQNWEKYLKYIWIGNKDTSLTLSVNGVSKAYCLADIIGTKSGIYNSEYQYTDDKLPISVTATGIPLDKFISDAGVTSDYIIKLSSNEVIKDPSRCMIAYNAESQEGQITSSTGRLVLYSPGETKKEVVRENLSELTVSIKPPAVVTGLKAVGVNYSKIKLTWNKVSGAQSYNIYRYNAITKKYQLYDCTEGANKTYFIDTGLKTGTKYIYKIKACMTVGTEDIESSYSKGVSAVPYLGKTSTKIYKSGKTSRKIKWSKVTGASGYQIKLGANKSISKSVKTYYTKSLTKTITKLKKGKYYYVKVRPYRYVSGKKVYGYYSSVKLMKL